MKHFAFLLLLVQSAPAQESDAEKLYRQMEARLTSAKTLQFSLTATVKAKEPESIEGTIALAEGNKVCVDLVYARGQTKGSNRVVSDGNAVGEMRDGKKRPDTAAVPAELKAVISLGCARAGAEMLYRYSWLKGREAADKALVLSDFKSGGREKIGDVEAEIVEYSVEIPRVGKASMRVWIDPKRHLPLRRTMTATKDGETGSSTTTYRDYRIDEPIDDAKFKLP